ncbi:MAG: hypothetical protein P4K94_01555 [Terracidiphilus sp.]|nr:hypothetical protein [Terracidiphilus sp.]
MTDIPQMDGSCLKPSTADEREMSDAFDAANWQSHKWEQKFTIPAGYRLLSRDEADKAEACLGAHGRDTARCANYVQLKHVRFLGVPGFDRAHSRALVSVVKMCGGDCGSSGIFAVEKVGGKWQRSEPSEFTQNCS